MDSKAYLERINYDGPLLPTADTLKRIHVAHLLTVPFENLSIHIGEPITLNDAALFDKIVSRRRGGFCYELNGLFAALLGELGFTVTMLAAKAANAAGVFGPPFDHMALMVNLSERWLVDVGFGDSFVEPLLLDERSTQLQRGRSYQVSDEEDGLLLQRADEVGGSWMPQYRFSLEPHKYSDYAEMCTYHQTSPDSHFTKGRICSRATAAGRITLSDMRLITTTGSDREERLLADEDEYAMTLRDRFGVVLTKETRS